MRLEAIMTMKPTSVGSAVRLTTAVGEIPAAPATVMTTPEMGDTERNKPPANCIGVTRFVALPDKPLAIPGASDAKDVKTRRQNLSGRSPDRRPG